MNYLGESVELVAVCIGFYVEVVFAGLIVILVLGFGVDLL